MFCVFHDKEDDLLFSGTVGTLDVELVPSLQRVQGVTIKRKLVNLSVDENTTPEVLYRIVHGSKTVLKPMGI